MNHTFSALKRSVFIGILASIPFFISNLNADDQKPKDQPKDNSSMTKDSELVAHGGGGGGGRGGHGGGGGYHHGGGDYHHGGWDHHDGDWNRHGWDGGYYGDGFGVGVGVGLGADDFYYNTNPYYDNGYNYGTDDPYYNDGGSVYFYGN